MWVTVHKAAVAKADFFGKSDPFVIVTLDGAQATTTTIKSTVNPEWNQTFQFPVRSAEPVLQVEVFDSDLIGSCLCCFLTLVLVVIQVVGGARGGVAAAAPPTANPRWLAVNGCRLIRGLH